MIYGNCSKSLKTSLFLFSNKLLVIRDGIHKMLVRTVNRADPDQTASEEFRDIDNTSSNCINSSFKILVLSKL